MSAFNTKAIIGRVKLLREQYAGVRGRKEFAKALGISASTYSYYEYSRIPPIDVLLKICELTGADLYWLLTGSKSGKDVFFGQNAALLKKIDAIVSENPEMAASIAAFAELLCQKKGLETAVPVQRAKAAPVKPGWIPVLGRTAAGMVHYWAKHLVCGSDSAVTELGDLVEKHLGREILEARAGALSVDLHSRPLVSGVMRNRASLIQVAGDTDQDIVEFVECPDIANLYEDAFALRIDGDSMSPGLNDGDIVIVSASVSAAQGQAAIVRVKNQIGVTCKLLRTSGDQAHLIPINEKYETKVVSKRDVEWALAVLCHVRF